MKYKLYWVTYIGVYKKYSKIYKAYNNDISYILKKKEKN